MNCSTDIILILHQLAPIIICLAIFDWVMKVVSLWYAARRNQLVWFGCLVVFNTAGILPIIYLLINKDKKSENIEYEK